MTETNPFLAARAAGAPRGEFVGSAVAQLSELINSKGGMEQYLEWIKLPLTRVVLDVIEDMARQPQGLSVMPTKDEIPVQYGITTGLQFAGLLMRDPTAIIGGWRPQQLDPDSVPITYGVEQEEPTKETSDGATQTVSTKARKRAERS